MIRNRASVPLLILLVTTQLPIACTVVDQPPNLNGPTVALPEGPAENPGLVEISGGPSIEGEIAFVMARNGKFDICVLDVATGKVTNLTSDLNGGLDPAWSTDGKHIAFTSGPGGVSQVFSMDADGSNRRQLTSDKAASWGPAWSPDGTSIVFLSERDGVVSFNKGVPVPEVYVMHADGTDQRRLTNNLDFERELAWSPMGNVIAVSINRLENSGIYLRDELYLMDAEGVMQRRLSANALDIGHPTWSPDGELIAFSSNRGGESGIYVVKADGSGEVRLAVSRNTPTSSLYVNNLSPSWSPDGKYILFASNRGGKYDLYVIRADGTGLTRLISLQADVLSPTWSPMP